MSSKFNILAFNNRLFSGKLMDQKQKNRDGLCKGLAILISAHKDFGQLNRLIETLRHPEVDIYLHIDIKSELDKSIFENVKFIEKRFNVRWGTISQVAATTSSLKEMIENNYTNYIFISGQDYPIFSIEKIVEFIKDNPCIEFMEYKKIGKDGWDVESRYSQIHTNNRYINYILRKFINKRKFIEGFVPYGGSSWWILTDKAVRYIIETYEKYDMSKQFEYTKCIDEVVYQSILVNSEFKDNIVNDHKRYIDWSDYAKRLNIGNPNILKKDDFEKIINSEAFFARKFDAKIDSEILDMLDEYRGDISNIRNKR